MHAVTILQRCLSPLLKHMHACRLATLLEAVTFWVSGPVLSLTDVGRRFAGEALVRHKIKRADRLLGNRRLQQEARSVYAALCRVTLACIGEPIILIDWSDLKADQSLHLLRASLPVGGWALTLYEEVHPQKKLGNRAVQHCCRWGWHRSSWPIPDSSSVLSRGGTIRLGLGGTGARA